MYNNDFFQNMNMDTKINGDNNYVNNEMDVDVNMMNGNNMMPNNSMPMNEGVRERVINRTFVHEVPQVC